MRCLLDFEILTRNQGNDSSRAITALALVF